MGAGQLLPQEWDGKGLLWGRGEPREDPGHFSPEVSCPLVHSLDALSVGPGSCGQTSSLPQ